MGSSFGNCEKIVRDKKIVLKENQCRMVFDNRSELNVKIVEIDGCMEIDGKRCDYLVITNAGAEHFIELKGCNVIEATKQLENSIKKLSGDPKKQKKYCFIISTRCPLLTAQIQQLKVLYKKLYNSMLIIKNKQCTHSI